MCNLIEHTARDARQQTARQAEPIYAKLADEYGIPYEGPELPVIQPFGPTAISDYQPPGHTGR